jgi:hypothetical protein
MTLFQRFVSLGMSIARNHVDLYVLQHMFIPRINEDLQRWRESWNSHPISTEGNRSPYQLLEIYRDRIAPPYHPNCDINDEDGYESEESEVSSDSDGEDQPQVELDPIVSPFEFEDDEIEFFESVPPLSLEETWENLEDMYLHGVYLAKEILNR